MHLLQGLSRVVFVVERKKNSVLNWTAAVFTDGVLLHAKLDLLNRWHVSWRAQTLTSFPLLALIYPSWWILNERSLSDMYICSTSLRCELRRQSSRSHDFSNRIKIISVLMMLIILHSCQRAAVRAWAGETGRLWRSRTADGHTDQEGDLCGHTLLDGSRGHPAVRLRLQGEWLAAANTRQASLLWKTLNFTITFTLNQHISWCPSYLRPWLLAACTVGFTHLTLTACWWCESFLGCVLSDYRSVHCCWSEQAIGL